MENRIQLGIIILALIATGSLFVLSEKRKNEQALQKIEFIQGGDIQKAQTIDSLITKTNTLQVLIDSLRAEDFTKQTTIERYEIAIEYLNQVHPKCGKQLERYIHEIE